MANLLHQLDISAKIFISTPSYVHFPKQFGSFPRLTLVDLPF